MLKLPTRKWKEYIYIYILKLFFFFFPYPSFKPEIFFGQDVLQKVVPTRPFLLLCQNFVNFWLAIVILIISSLVKIILPYGLLFFWLEICCYCMGLFWRCALPSTSIRFCLFVNWFFLLGRSSKEKRSSYAPEKKGLRYDGIYRIEKCWRKNGIQVRCLF